MNRTTTILVTAFLIAGQASISSAKMGRVDMMLEPCGNGELCAVDDPGFTSAGSVTGGGTSDDLAYGTGPLPPLGSEGTTTCETTYWGDEREGGRETVCSSEDGSSYWYSAEWSDGVLVEDEGSVTVYEDDSFTAETRSSDLTTTAPAKFQDRDTSLAR